MTGRGDEDADKWFSYLLEPNKLTNDIVNGVPFSSLKPLLYDFLSNLLNNQTAGFFTDNPQELWFAKSEERKCTVLRNLCLRLASYSGWCLTELEEYLPPPLLLFLLTSLVQVQPGQEEEETSLANTTRHVEVDVTSLANPGPSLQALVLLHRWVVRTFMVIRTPVRTERTSNMMVPGVKRDPAIIYRDQTHTLVSAVAPTSIKFLQSVLDCEVSPVNVPSYRSFPLQSSWDVASLQPVDKLLFQGLTAYDLGRCYLFCEDYVKAKQCFTKYFECVGENKLQQNSFHILKSEIDDKSLAGYLLCLGLEMPGQTSPKPTFLMGEIIESINRNYENVDTLLEKDDVVKNVSVSAKEALEHEMTENISSVKNSREKQLLSKVQMHNVIKRTMLGLPLSSKHRTMLLHVDDKTGLENCLVKKFNSASEAKKSLLKCLIIELVMYGIISQKSDILRTCQVGYVTIPELSNSSVGQSKKKPTKLQTFNIETFGSDKIIRLNNCLQLLSSFTSQQISSLVANIGGKNIKKISNRWTVESDQLNRQKNNSDHLFLTMAKVSQLKKMKRFGDALVLLKTSHPNGGNLVEAEKLHMSLEMEISTEADYGVKATLMETNVLANLCHTQLTVSTLTSLLNTGDWEAVIKWSQPNQPHITNCPPHQSTIVVLIRDVAHLMNNIRANNPPVVKKFGRDIWELVCNVAQSGPAAGTKRQSKDNIIDNSATRTVLTAWMKTVTHEHCSRLLSSVLASLFNVVRDDPNTDILSPDGALWPTHVSQPLQERTVEDMLTQVLTSALSHHPHDPNLIRMMGDLQFANTHYASALGLYVEAAAVKTDFYHHELGPVAGQASCLDETVLARMVTCARELGRLTQAVVLSQFTQEPNYAQIFKFLEDRTQDGSDCLYGCIWDMAILEFAMSLHTKRGEAARRREALQCIWQLELNTNNDEEIIKEAANVRKAMFFRSLSLQMF